VEGGGGEHLLNGEIKDFSQVADLFAKKTEISSPERRGGNKKKEK